MYQIDNSTSAATQPAPSAAGTPGFFTDGNPATGVQATVVPAEWLNAVMMEIVNAITASGIELDKSKFNQLAQAMGAQSPGRLLNVQVFDTPGTYTYTSTPGTNSVVVEVQGGGAGSGGVAATSSTQVAASGAGGAGAYAKSRYTSGFAGVNVVVGVGGPGGAAGTNNGLPGGTSSFGTLVSAPGGSPGGSLAPTTTIPSLRGGSTNSSAPAGGNIVQTPGGPGGGTLAIALNSGSLGSGATSMFGSGGLGGQGNGAAPTAGQGHGAGAGGTLQIAGAAASPGAAGSAGIVIVWEHA